MKKCLPNRYAYIANTMAIDKYVIAVCISYVVNNSLGNEYCKLFTRALVFSGMISVVVANTCLQFLQ